MLILNRYDGKSGINARDVEGNIKHPVTGVIPRDDKATALALTRGIPVIMTQRGISLSQSLYAMARMLKREEEPVTRLRPVRRERQTAPSQPPKMAIRQNQNAAF